jgi:endonuclease III
MARIALRQAIKKLEATYGLPEPPPADPWLNILAENVVYLADDDRRAKALSTLKKRVGLKPEQIASASDEALMEATRFGIMAESRAEKLRTCARIALEEFDGDMKQVFDWPEAKALRALQKFPGIGRPGAERLLLFARHRAGLPLESNGLRVLVRLGFGAEVKDYAATYRLVQDAIAPELPPDFDWLIAAHQLLRTHGQETCKNAKPKCDECPLVKRCVFASEPEA